MKGTQTGKLSPGQGESTFACSRQLFLNAFVIVCLTLIAYLPALSGGFVWDDQQNVAENQLLGTVEGLKQTWVNPHALIQYYPLTYTGFWVEHQLWGLEPLEYHLVNVLLHALNACLLGILLTRLSVPGAWLAAFIFAVHPVHVESVAWITELKNVLSGAFFLSAFLAYLRFQSDSGRRWRFYGLALFLFLCALLSKTATIMLPAAILLVLWWKQERIRWNHVSPLTPFFLMAVTMATVTNWVEKHQSGALGAEWQLPWVERCLVAGRAVWFYAAKLIWPHPLMFVYPRWQINAAVWWQYLFPVGTVAVILSLWFLRKRWGKAPFIAVFFFMGSLAPVPAFFNLYFMRFSYVTDHFQYLPSIGLIALMSGVAANVCRTRQALIAFTAAVMVALSALSWQHCEAFRNNETLWRDTIAKNPDCWMAHNNLGRLLREAGNVQEAIQHYEIALQIKPDYAEAHYNLGNAFSQIGRIQEAIKHYERALQIDPDYLQAHSNLAFALLQTGKIREAIGHLEQAVRINSGSSEAHFNLGLALASQGKLDEAIAQIEAALRLNPNYAEAHYVLGNTLAQTGKLKDAATQFEQAIRLKPDFIDARVHLQQTQQELARLQQPGTSDQR